MTNQQPSRRPWWILAVLVGVGGIGLAYHYSKSQASTRLLENAIARNAELDPPQPQQDDKRQKTRAPELDGGVAWLNTAGPISMKDLRGKFVLLDFWTFCCINCIHTLPDLAKLEKKYPNELVVIGVHSAKFENEKNSENIKKAILRYEISHPVVNDARMAIWQAYGTSSWPTLVLIDPEGYIIGVGSGEGLGDAIDRILTDKIKVFREKKLLKEEPLRFDLARYKERNESPLYFPGKVLADVASNRIFIADSTHHRIVITDLNGKFIDAAGVGVPDRADGNFDQAKFNDPQGMALKGDTLYVADRKNHLIRALDLKARTVKTIAGIGRQGEDRFRGGDPIKTGLNSPWALLLKGDILYVALAGHHQIWTLDLAQNTLSPFAGNGRENIVNGPHGSASFAQPSGLATDGTVLFVADSEVSAVRTVPLNGKGEVKTLLGSGLFDFGDVDGVGDAVRLQHALGVAFHEGKVYIADTYNSKIKVLDPETRSCTTILGGQNGAWQKGDLFLEPAGLCVAGDKLYVADTNNHRIRIVDLKTRELSTLKLDGVRPPKTSIEDEPLVFPNPIKKTMPSETIADGKDLILQVKLDLPLGIKLNAEAPSTYLIEAVQGEKVAWSDKQTVPAGRNSFPIQVQGTKLNGATSVRLSLLYYECEEGNKGLCRIKSLIWDLPIKLDPAAAMKTVVLTGPS